MSAGGFLDACGFIAASSGTGNFVVALAIQGYQTPANAGAVNGTVYSYRAESADKSQWEEGYGAYTTSSTTLARTTITANSSGGTSAINFSAAPNIFITALSADIQNAALLTSGTLPGPRIASLLPGYVGGLTLSTAGSSPSFSVASGAATDSTAADIIALSSSLSKTTGSWSSGNGNGALDTGTIAASSWYHVHLIKNETSGAVDVLVSLSASSPTLPSGYAVFRRIGSMKTDGSSHWVLFVQFGNEFLWSTAVNDVNTTVGTTATLFTLSVPPGVQVNALIRGLTNGATAAESLLINSPDEAAVALDSPVGNRTVQNPLASSASGAIFTLNVRTNTSAQVRGVSSTNTIPIIITTYGWIDLRGGGASSGGAAVTSNALAPFLRSYLAGLTLSTVGSSATFSVAAGVAADSTDADMMTLSASFSKTTSAFSAGSGNGGLDTGTIAASTWYHAHLIKNEGTGAVDVLVSLSATSPTMPSSFTLFRRIGSMKTDGSSHWTAFVQVGDEFLWSTSSNDQNPATVTTTASLLTLNVATGVQVHALFRGQIGAVTASVSLIFTSPDESDQSAATPQNDLITANASSSFTAGRFNVRTNASAQIRARSSLSGGVNCYIGTFGWLDRRGKDN